jgi:hypothetical protein
VSVAAGTHIGSDPTVVTVIWLIALAEGLATNCG